MALTNEHIGNLRFHDEIEYGFYGADGTIGDSVAPGKPWKLRSIQIHFSVAFASIEYLVMALSSILGATYNTILYSLNVSGSTDIFIHYSDPLLFLSDDHLNFELSMVSGTNIIGFRFETWAARG